MTGQPEIMDAPGRFVQRVEQWTSEELSRVCAEEGAL
ncbi:hypothetical protein PM3016_2829 [Paenibacillus mucilaginosus 3016]|uniref:Uncharacterized protein n=1 Tax=Paenibacillus mucilaginosus 3016 TaxID=1116391 RepID=H6NJM5_9BACL|nr:hypothetical protein PM3016_2829 [Paenibacillus mucilaginosus 3016]